MAFIDVYECKEAQIEQLYQRLAENFFDDDLYVTVFPDPASRKRLLRYFFRHYIKTIRPYSHVIADSEAMNSVMVVYDSALEISWKYHLRLVLLNMKMVPMLLSLHSWTSIKHVIKCWDMFTSRWVTEFVVGDSYHIDLLYTMQEHRGNGLAKKLLEVVCEDAKQKGIDVTLETHHESTVALYEQVGFKLMSVITHPNVSLKQYCLLIRNREV